MALSRLEYLLNRHIARNISADEREELLSMIEDSATDDELLKLIEKVVADPGTEVEMPETVAREVLFTILGTPERVGEPDREPGVLMRMGRKWTKWAAAAVLALLAGGLVWIKIARHRPGPIPTVSLPIAKGDVTPGSDKATLRLADGSLIVLDSAQNGELSREGAAQVTKAGNGLLAYSAVGTKSATPVYNTINIPSRGQYQVILSDGTKVWLNSLSSLRLPTAFEGGRREVEVTGEAYFEVAPDKRAPFVVSLYSTSGRQLRQRVQVLGTAFNVMCYDDEPVLRTTVVEGAVRLTSVGELLKVTGGQEAEVDAQGKARFVSDANIDKAIAWKNGNFQFDGDDIGEVMRQLTRWYGVEVKFESMPKVHYTGGITRNLNISKVLNMLSLSGLHCRIEGNTVIVLP